MIIDCNYKDKNKSFFELNKISVDLFCELYKFLNRNTSLSKFGIFQIDGKLNDAFLRKLVNICKKSVFSNFSLVLRPR